MRDKRVRLALKAAVLTMVIAAAGWALAWSPTLTTITVDAGSGGGFDDWQPVLANPFQVTFDGDGTSFADCGLSIDRDCGSIAGTGRDIYYFAWTFDDQNLFLYTERVEQQGNSVQIFYFYMDVTGDERMGPDDLILRVRWHPNNPLELTLFNYIPADPLNGDPLVDAGGWADGHIVPGYFDPAAPLWSATQPGQARLRMECGLPWSALGVPAGTPIRFHVGSSALAEPNLTDPANPLGIIDNAGGPDGRLGNFGFTGIIVAPDHFGSAASPGMVEYPFTLTNTGNDSDVFSLRAISNRGLGVEIWADLDGDGIPDELMAFDSEGDGSFDGPADILVMGWDSLGDGLPDTGAVPGGQSFQVVVRLLVPEGLSGLTDRTLLEAVSSRFSSERDTATATTGLGLLTIGPASDLSGLRGGSVPHPAVVRNNAVEPHLGSFELATDLGWTVRLWLDVDGDGLGDVLLGEDIGGNGTWDSAPGDSNGDGVPDTGDMAPGSSLEVVVEVLIPAGAAVGDLQRTIVRVRPQASLGDVGTAVFRSKAADVLVLEPEYQLAFATNLSALAGDRVFFPHVLRNNGPTADCYALSAISAQGWNVRIWSDPDGDGTIADGALISNTCDAVASVAPHGGAFSFIIEVQVPTGVAADTLGVIDVTATSVSDPALFVTGVDEVRVGHLRLYRDAAGSVQARHFSVCSAVHLRAGGLVASLPSGYRLDYFTPSNLLHRQVLLPTDGRGEGTDALLLGEGVEIGAWRVDLVDTSNGVLVDRLAFFVEDAASIPILQTGAESYSSGEAFSIDIVLENTAMGAVYLDTILELLVSTPDGLEWLRPDGTFGIYTGTEHTRLVQGIDLYPGGGHDDGLAIGSVVFPAAGAYGLFARWLTSCGHVLAERFESFGVLPPAPSITAPPDGSVTNTATSTVAGQSEPGALVQVRVGGLVTESTTATATGEWELVVTLADGDHVLDAVQLVGGYQSSPSAPVQLRVDTIAPAAPVITTPEEGAVISQHPVIVSGEAEPLATIELRDAADALIGTTHAGHDGIWSLEAALGEGLHALRALAADAAGNVSLPSLPRAFEIDRTPPALTVATPQGLTNDPRPAFSGTTESGAVVEIQTTGGPVAATVDVAGGWSWTPASDIADSAYSWTVTATDPAGNIATATADFEIDTLPPALTVATPQGLTNDPRPAFSGTTESGAVVEIQTTGGPVAATVDVAGGWSWTPASDIADGVHSWTVTATDPAGNIATATADFEIDTLPPPAPVIAHPGEGLMTNALELTASGTAEPGSTVRVELGGVLIGEVPAALGDGAWSADLGGLAEGEHTLLATATDAAGNVSEPSSVGFEVDRTAPPAPLINHPSQGLVTNAMELTASGTAEPGSTVRVELGGVVLGTVVAAPGDGTWSLTLGALTEGEHTLAATAIDAAGNQSSAASSSFTIDRTPPSPPQILNPENASHLSTATVEAAGLAEPGVVVVLELGAFGAEAPVGGDGGWSLPLPLLWEGEHTLAAHAVDQAGNESAQVFVTFIVDLLAPEAPIVFSPVDGQATTATAVTVEGWAEPGSTVTIIFGGVIVAELIAGSDGGFLFDLPLPDEGWQLIEVYSTDLAGNESPATMVGFLADRTAPAPPVITEPEEGEIFTEAQVWARGTAEADALVRLFVSGAVVSVQAGPGGAWQYRLPALVEGQHQLVATATDAAGNESDPASVGFIIRTSPPLAPTILLPAAGAWLADASVTVSGSAEAGSVVTIWSGEGLLAEAGPADAGGAWSVDIELHDGLFTIWAFAHADGLVSPPSATRTFGVDTSMPQAPVLVAPADGVTLSTAWPTFAGTAEVGVSVEVFVDGDAVGMAFVSDDGRWSLVPSDPLLEGSRVAHAVAVGLAGARSAPSATHGFVIDLSLPPAPVITSPVDGHHTRVAELSVSGSARQRALVELFLDGAGIGTTTADAGGAWSLPVVFSEEGVRWLWAREILTGGAHGPVSDPVAVVFDITPPGAPVVIEPSPGSVIRDESPLVVGTAEPGATVTVVVDGQVQGQAVAGADGSFVVTMSAQPEGELVIEVFATDRAGNESDPTVVAFRLDFSPPSAPEILAPEDGSLLLESEVAILGTAEPGSTVVVRVDDEPVGEALADALGAFEVLVTLKDGLHTATAVARDEAGNESQPSSAVSFEVDAELPNAPTLINPAHGLVTPKTRPLFSGTAGADEGISIFLDGALLGETQAESRGRWYFTPESELSSGNHHTHALAHGRHGRVSPPSQSHDFVIDVSLEPAPTITSPQDGQVTSTARLEVEGLAAFGDEVDLYVDAVYQSTAGVSGGVWAMTILLEGAGIHELVAFARDSATVSGASDIVQVIFDPSLPATPTIDEPASGSVVATSSPVISGKAEPGLTVVVVVGGSVVAEVVASGDGSWHAALPPRADGEVTVAAHAEDSAGKKSGTVEVTFVIDTVAPSIPEITSPSSGAVFATSEVEILGLSEPGSIVTLHLSGLELGIQAGPVLTRLDGTWSLDVSLADGVWLTAATAADAAGNVSGASDSVSITIDTIAPDRPLIVLPMDRAVLTERNPTIAGLAEPASLVTVMLSGVELPSTAADAEGRFELSPADPLDYGEHAVAAIARDDAGNTSAPSRAVRFVILDPEAAECLIDADCPADLVCHEGRCLDPGEVPPECQGDEDCPGEQVCEAGECVDPGEVPPECEGDEDCPGEQVCEAGECVDPGEVPPDCLGDEDCSGEQVCEAGECVDPGEVPPECLGDEDCSGEQVCEAGECVDPGEVPPECQGDEDCPGEQVCEAGECVPDGGGASPGGCGGCSCSSANGGGTGGAWPALLGLLAVLLVRPRRRISEGGKKPGS